jgi:lysophospholipase L1-like esterase
LGYLHETQKLIDRSDRFPRSYAVGDGRELNYVSLGDSTAQGVGAAEVSGSLTSQIASLIPRRVKVLNLAQSGATLEDLVNLQIPQIPWVGINLITVSISANDVTHNSDLATFRKHLETMIVELEAHHPIAIVLSDTPNYSTVPALPWIVRKIFYSRADSFTRAIQTASRSYRNVFIADLFTHGTIPTEDYAADGFHPSPEGYAIWANVFVDAIRRSPLGEDWKSGLRLSSLER